MIDLESSEESKSYDLIDSVDTKQKPAENEIYHMAEPTEVEP